MPLLLGRKGSRVRHSIAHAASKGLSIGECGVCPPDGPPIRPKDIHSPIADWERLYLDVAHPSDIRVC
ncbi:hypothetical protein MJO29_005013 [Puccinia striiformis f. sp. tritici]|nr:hypothetical protein MJO29_005013 [Puccinia striiformis f. sp. tritici]